MLQAGHHPRYPFPSELHHPVRQRNREGVVSIPAAMVDVILQTLAENGVTIKAIWINMVISTMRVAPRS